MIKKVEINKQFSEINEQLCLLKDSIDNLRKERHRIIEEEKRKIREIVSVEVRKISDIVQESIQEISKQTTGQIYKLYHEGKIVGKKIDEIAQEKAAQKAAETLYSIEKQAERKLTENIKHHIEKETSRIKDDLAEAEKMAVTDELTQIFNRRYFEPTFKTEWSFAKKTGNNLSIMILDIDNFKEINDKYGHQVGDNVLIEIAAILKKGLRKRDMLARYGGDEFIIAFPGLPKEKAETTAKRLKKRIFGIPLYYKGKYFSAQVSIGVASYPDDDAETHLQLIDRADKRLLKGKSKGKNIVVNED